MVTLSFPIYATTIHIVGRWNRTRDTMHERMVLTIALPQRRIIYRLLTDWRPARRSRDCENRTKRIYDPHTASRGIMTRELFIVSTYTLMLANAGKARMLAALVGTL